MAEAIQTQTLIGKLEQIRAKMDRTVTRPEEPNLENLVLKDIASGTF